MITVYNRNLLEMGFQTSLFFIFVLLAASSTAQECRVHDTCVCEYDDGQGYDLRPVVTGENILEAFVNENYTVFYHPCGDTTKPLHLPDNVTDKCKNGYMLCVHDILNKTAKVLGKQANMEFKSSGDNHMQVIFIKPEEPEDLQKSSVLLECAPQSKSSVLYAFPEFGPGQYNVVLYSKNACREQVGPDRHHGFFYTMFIVLLTLLFVYLFLGIMINYFFVGARGFELIPNYDFWCKTWTSAKLFFIYVKNGCRVIPNEDSYDAI